MWNEITTYKWQYLILVIGMVGFGLLFMAVWPNHAWQRVVALSIGGFYFIWGSVTHLHAQHLTARIVWEYLGVSLLASTVLLLLTW